MDTISTQIRLSGTDSFIPQNPKDAYRVVSGTVLVFIAPWKGGAPGRRLLLCEVPQGKVIPAFVYRDSDYQQWRFILVAKDTAELSVMENQVTRILHRRFCQLANLSTEEDFCPALVDFYNREKLKDDIYIGRGKKQTPNVNIASYGVIRKAFHTNPEITSSNDPLYRAVAFGCRKRNISLVPPEKLAGKELTVPAIAQASHFACRAVVLEPDWFRQDCGVILSSIDGNPVCCVPKRQGYEIFDSRTGEAVPLTPGVAQTVSPQGFTISPTLPSRKLKVKDLISFGFRCMHKADLAFVVLLALVTSLIGVLLPTLNQKIYDEYIPLGIAPQMIQLCLVICTFMLGNLLFGIVKNLSENRISSRIGYDLQNAVYYRIFHLPESFFRRFDSADLAQRLSSASAISNTLVGAVVTNGIGALFAVVYLWQMFKYSSVLSWIGIALVVIYGVIQFLLFTGTQRHDRVIADSEGQASSKLYQFLGGIEKLRMAGMEDQAAYEYMVPFSQVQMHTIRKNRLESVIEALGSVISTIFSMILYFVIVKKSQSISMGSFIAFNTAFGSFSGALLGLIGSAVQMYQMKPLYQRFKPIIETAQEDEEDCESVEQLSGNVSLHNVTFSYNDSGVNVLNNLSIDIRPGEYVGIVGPSGCGKSTLLKLLLGFEKPRTGKVCYDGRDLSTLDKRQLRKNLGVVLQNGKLIAGSIYENITITAPHATMKDVQAVVEAVGLKDDIAQMPMGLHTVLSESSGTISGGQQQRILIARAIISRPSILIFDEATSALDNLTQAAVCESLDKMDVTRIVVAHRLSTIKSCDRILVLHNGTVAEEGSYTSLMAKGGLFYQLARRQIVD